MEDLKTFCPVTGCPKNMQKGGPFFTSKCHFLRFIVSITEARKQIKQWLIVNHSPSLCPGSGQIKVHNYRVSKKHAK